MTSDQNYICAQDYRPLLENKIYEAQCVGSNDSFVLGKSRKLFLDFRIIDPGIYFEKEIFMAFNMPYNRKIKPGSKYYKTWVKINGNRPPSRNTIMSPKLFHKKIYKIKTRTVKPKSVDGKEMPEEFFYSIVDCIIEVIA